MADFIGETDFIPGTFVVSQDGRAVVDTALGRMAGVLGDPVARPAPGAKVTLCVRPECWTLSDRQPSDNWVRGRIGEAIYLGELAQYALQAGDRTLKVIELNPRFLEKSGQGEVYARADPEDVVVLAD